MASKQVLLCGYYGYGNGGDEALLSTLLQMLPPSVIPVVMSATPAKTAQDYGVVTCNRNDPLAVMRALIQADAFIWGGGSLIQDVTSWASPLFYLGWMGIAQLLGRTTLAWAQGIGPLNRPISRAMARWTFSRCSARSTRDRASAHLLDQWHLDYVLAPDPVWALAGTPPGEGLSCASPQMPRVQVTASEGAAPPCLAVVLRRHPQLTEDRLDCIIQALGQIQAQNQAKLLLLPFQRSQDYEIALQIQTRLPNPSELVMLEDPRRLKGIFQRIDLVIAMRLHALIMAASEGCRGYALSYDPKVRQLMEDLHLPGIDLETLPPHPQSLIQDWQQALESPASFDSGIIRDRIEAAKAHQQLLHQVLGKG
ncbi:polysaccharide pyruvyl transferase CsaB [Lyngbya confervoides]|uniref:Polysaccharide pyruvyl transferase CsaB n=1 Tax=Lyngbya confervoides BDU141951 TaxID=1574623 RepID=A0ABD4SYW2_9CYAN|nr:polysaccharide pyruvyl transferase CsaB [Lyngbya confervoides]MCM1981662.1 polysaccharide pyruvyl transferase CsaB [Lyngbya confervoides BDU141951]